MPNSISYGCRPDLPDPRDMSVLGNKALGFANNVLAPPGSADLRDENLDFEGLASAGAYESCAVAVITALNWSYRKWTGLSIHTSPTFLHQLSLKIVGGGERYGLGLRSTIKTIKRFGAPPSQLVSEFQPRNSKQMLSDPIFFGYRQPFRNLSYLRMDQRPQSWETTVANIRLTITRSLPVLVGVSTSMSFADSESDVLVARSPKRETTNGAAAVIVGFDDKKVLSQYGLPDGAVAARFCGKTNSDEYWIPYSAFRNGTVFDAWALLDPTWEI